MREAVFKTDHLVFNLRKFVISRPSQPRVMTNPGPLEGKGQDKEHRLSIRPRTVPEMHICFRFQGVNQRVGRMKPGKMSQRSTCFRFPGKFRGLVCVIRNVPCNISCPISYPTPQSCTIKAESLISSRFQVDSSAGYPAVSGGLNNQIMNPRGCERASRSRITSREQELDGFVDGRGTVVLSKWREFTTDK
jgi:hypothetical protein